MKNELLKQIPTVLSTTVTQSDVYFILKSINANKSTGPDKISGRIIKVA